MLAAIIYHNAAYGIITPDNCLAFIFLPMESHTVVKYQSIITKNKHKIYK